jgi:hypothetical protein
MAKQRTHALYKKIRILFSFPHEQTTSNFSGARPQRGASNTDHARIRQMN